VVGADLETFVTVNFCFIAAEAPGSIPGHSMRDLIWPYWQCDRFYFEYFCFFPLSVSVGTG